jgi:hypothetical protein
MKYQQRYGFIIYLNVMTLPLMSMHIDRKNQGVMPKKDIVFRSLFNFTTRQFENISFDYRHFKTAERYYHDLMSGKEIIHSWLKDSAKTENLLTNKQIVSLTHLAQLGDFYARCVIINASSRFDDSVMLNEAAYCLCTLRDTVVEWKSDNTKQSILSEYLEGVYNTNSYLAFEEIALRTNKAAQYACAQLLEAMATYLTVSLWDKKLWLAKAKRFYKKILKESEENFSDIRHQISSIEGKFESLKN